MTTTYAGRPVAAAQVAARQRRMDPVPWITTLFVLTFLLQRISIPNLNISVTIGIAGAWVVAGLIVGVITFNRTRALVWLLAAGISGLLVIAQIVGVGTPYVSFNSWALWIVIWLPVVVQFRDRSQQTFLRACRAIGNVGLGMSALSLVFMGVQAAGIRYYDWLSTVLPANLLVQDFVISYPTSYGSTIYKSNGWIALEPSFMSFMIGFTLICALLARMSVIKVGFLMAGMLSTVAGSGIFLIAVFIAVIIAQGRFGTLRKYLVPGAVIGVIFATTALGEAILGRVTEVGSSNSSTSLRAVEPYVQLYPYWITDPVGIFVGYGPGSSADVVKSLGIDGLLVPSVAKVLFDYGLIGGAALIAMMVMVFVRGPSKAFALALAGSMFLLQAAAQPLVICSIMAIAFWAPTPPAPRIFDNSWRSDDREARPPAPRPVPTAHSQPGPVSPPTPVDPYAPQSRPQHAQDAPTAARRR